MDITTIELPIYELDLIVIIDLEWSSANKKFKLQLDPEDLEAHALTKMHPEYKGRHELYLLLKPEHLDNNTLIHEIYHLVSWICLAKGITLDADNDEPLAYLAGYIGEKVLEFKEKYIEKNLHSNIKALPL